MTLTYLPDLDILPLDLHANIQVHMSVRLAGRVRRTHTHTQTDDVRTITPDTSETWGVIMPDRVSGLQANLFVLRKYDLFH